METADYLRSILDYDPDTGKFVWKERNDVERPRKAGTPAGSVHRATGYHVIRICTVAYYAHHIAWAIQTGKWPDHEIDHINRNRADNRFCNLRPALRVQQLQNASKRSDNTSGHKGVSRSPSTCSLPWRARIHAKGKEIHLGLFATKSEAFEAYRAAAKEFYGEYANAE